MIPLWARLMEANFVDCNCECHRGGNLTCCQWCADEDFLRRVHDRSNHDPGDEDR